MKIQTFKLSEQVNIEKSNDINKRIHIIGDQAITPYYLHAEGIKNADATIELVLQNLKYV
jgi:hypothetical protein